MDQSDTISGLRSLSEFLSKHFYSEVFVLIVEHDSPLMQAVFTEELKDDFSKVVLFNNDIISNTVKSNEFAHCAFITRI
jgi:hypothetical protein